MISRGGHALPLRTALEETLPQTVFSAADSLQQYHGLDLASGGTTDLYPCSFFGTVPPSDNPEPATLDLEGAIIVGDTSPGHCNDPGHAFIDDTINFVANSGGVVSPALSTVEMNEVVATMKSSHRDVGSGKVVFDHFRCNENTANMPNTGIGRCEYVIPGKRLNVFPDTVELVFLDGDREVSNPAYGIFLISRSAGGLAPNSFCTRTPTVLSSPWFNRSFVTEHRGATDPGNCP